MHTLNKPIGILGGTFDPIHFGHLRTAVEVQQTLDLLQIRILPSYMPVHKQTAVATAAQRLEMIYLATRATPCLVVDEREIKRAGASYMVDTLEDLRKQFPLSPLCLILGTDAFKDFIRWHRYTRILELAHLIVVPRDDKSFKETLDASPFLQKHFTDHPEYLRHHLNGSIYLQPIPLLTISSTSIRRQIQQAKNVRFLLPDAVYRFIRNRGIYLQS